MKVWILLLVCPVCAFPAGCAESARPAAPPEPEPPRQPEASAAAPKGNEIAQANFTFPADEGGRLLRERLTPPARAPLSPYPYLTEPLSWTTTNLDRQPGRATPLPLADTTPRSRPLPQEGPSGYRNRPALDLPPLATATSQPLLPGRPALPVGPGPSVASPDPNQPIPLKTIAQPVAGGTNPTADPTFDPSRQVMLSVVGALRDQPAPFLRLVIPDPFEHMRTVRLRSMPPESDEPAVPTSRPPVPPMPVKP